MKNTQQTIQKYTHLIVYFCILLDSCVVLLFVGIYPCYRIWCVPKHWTTVKEKQIMLHLFWQILQLGCDSRSEGMILFASQFSYSLEKKRLKLCDSVLCTEKNRKCFGFFPSRELGMEDILPLTKEIADLDIALGHILIPFNMLIVLSYHSV